MSMDKPELTLAIIEDLKAKGLNQSQIAEMFGVSRQAVSWHKKTYNGKTSPREEVLKHFPWEVPASMAQATAYRNIRDWGEWVATGGKGMSELKMRRVRALYHWIEKGFVLEFDPTIPPYDGVYTGGFAYRKRRKADGDLIIRVNEYTTLTDEGRLIWRLPPTLP